MTLLGFLAILSATWVPGLAILRALRLRFSFPVHAATAFYCSLAYTCVKVMLLTTCHAFSPTVVWLLAAAEFTVLVYLWRRPEQAALRPPWSLGSIIGVVLVLGAFYYMFSTFLLGNKPPISTFTHIDSVVSWNRWAGEWVAGHFPQFTYGYPPIIPTLWAYTYVFIGTREIDLFAKLITDLYILTLPLIALDLVLRRRFVFAAAFLLGLYFFGRSGLAMWTFQGMADAPLASACTLLFYLSYRFFHSEGVEEQRQYFTAATVVACAAALTKQQGMLFLVVVPTILLLALPKARRLTELGRGAAIVGVLAAPWHLYYLVQLLRGAERTNVGYLVNLTGKLSGHEGSPLRYMNGIEIWKNLFGPWFIYAGFPVLIVLGLVLLPRWRAHILFSVAGYFALWSVAFSYDPRNCLLLLPLTAFLFALLADSASERLAHPPSTTPAAVSTRFPRRPWAEMGITAALLVFAVRAQFSHPDAALRQIQSELDLHKGTFAVNQALRSAHDRGYLVDKLKTNYQVMCFLSEFAEPHPTFTFFENEKELLALASDTEIRTLVFTQNWVVHPQAIAHFVAAGFTPVIDSPAVTIYSRTSGAHRETP